VALTQQRQGHFAAKAELPNRYATALNLPLVEFASRGTLGWISTAGR
jgi:hypothetical protein